MLRQAVLRGDYGRALRIFQQTGGQINEDAYYLVHLALQKGDFKFAETLPRCPLPEHIQDPKFFLLALHPPPLGNGTVLTWDYLLRRQYSLYNLVHEFVLTNKDDPVIDRLVSAVPNVLRESNFYAYIWHSGTAEPRGSQLSTGHCLNKALNVTRNRTAQKFSVDSLAAALEEDTAPLNKERVHSVDAEQPILVYGRPDGQLDVADGRHRLANAILNNKSEIEAKVLRPDELYDCSGIMLNDRKTGYIYERTGDPIQVNVYDHGHHAAFSYLMAKDRYALQRAYNLQEDILLDEVLEFGKSSLLESYNINSNRLSESGRGWLMEMYACEDKIDLALRVAQPRIYRFEYLLKKGNLEQIAWFAGQLGPNLLVQFRDRVLQYGRFDLLWLFVSVAGVPPNTENILASDSVQCLLWYLNTYGYRRGLFSTSNPAYKSILEQWSV